MASEVIKAPGLWKFHCCGCHSKKLDVLITQLNASNSFKIELQMSAYLNAQFQNLM